MSKSHKNASLELEKLKFESLVVVCSACEERSDRPRHLKARTVRKGLKLSLAEAHCKVARRGVQLLGTVPEDSIAGEPPWLLIPCEPSATERGAPVLRDFAVTLDSSSLLTRRERCIRVREPIPPQV